MQIIHFNVQTSDIQIRSCDACQWQNHKGGKMKPFPSTLVRPKRPVRIQRVLLHCDSSIPEDGEEPMAFCHTCRKWYHKSCQSIPDVVFDRTYILNWFCSHCVSKFFKFKLISKLNQFLYQIWLNFFIVLYQSWLSSSLVSQLRIRTDRSQCRGHWRELQIIMQLCKSGHHKRQRKMNPSRQQTANVIKLSKKEIKNH